MSIPGYDRWKLRSDRDDSPEARSYACVSHDRFECACIRYKITRTSEPCECECHEFPEELEESA